MPDVPTFLCFQGVDRITKPYSKDITSSQPLSTSYELVISKLFQFSQQLALLTKRNSPILLEKYRLVIVPSKMGTCTQENAFATTRESSETFMTEF